VARLADACDGAGACVDSGSQVCHPYACSADACVASCAGDADCAPGHVCTGGACLKAAGVACSAGAECASAHCADSVCCDAPCDGTCSRCDLAGTVGVCTSIPAGIDPDDECEAREASTCGTTGACSGSGSCQLHPPGAVCSGATCSDGDTVALAGACDGAGTCVPGGTLECAPYVCAGGACTSGCAGEGDCAPGNTCVAGYCRTNVGGACRDGAECVSNVCVDQVCCSDPCTGVCQRCDLPGWAGTCKPIAVGSDPDDECAAQAASTCGNTGACSGAGSCQLHPAGTICAPAGCADMITFTYADTCDGAGRCQDLGTKSCSPYRCAGSSGCFTSCYIDLQCEFPEYACSPGQRCLLKDTYPCTSGAQCLHGACCGTPFGYCRNPAVDPNHCGACGTVCQPEGGTNTCVGGVCTPICEPGRLDCDDSRPNGCEENIEDRPLLQVCPNVVDMWNLGEHCGDVKCPSGFLTCAPVGFDNTPKVTWWGNGSQMVWATAKECTNCLATNTRQRIQLRSPDDANYDLYVYNVACALIGSSEFPGYGVVDGVDVEFNYTVLPDLHPYFVEVRWKSGGSCDNDWRLQIFGTTCP
jgi:hypothetical protein